MFKQKLNVEENCMKQVSKEISERLYGQMWIKMVWLLLFFAIATEANHPQLQNRNLELIGKIIQIEEEYRTASWIGIKDLTSQSEEFPHLKVAHMYDCAVNDIFEYDWARFKVIKCHEHDQPHSSDHETWVCLEFVSRKNWYLNSLYNSEIVLQESVRPKKVLHFHFSIECGKKEDGKFKNCRIYSRRGGEYFVSNSDDYVWWSRRETANTDLYDRSLFTIHAPQPHTNWTQVAEFPNLNINVTDVDYVVKVGVKNTKTRKNSLSGSLTTELSASYAGIDASISATLNKGRETTEGIEEFQETSFKISFVVQPNTKVYVKQEMGWYGPMRIETTNVLLECVFMDQDSKPCLNPKFTQDVAEVQDD